MRTKHEHIIKEVAVDSIAEEVGIEVGDILLSINDKKIRDILDYYFYIEDEYIEVEIQKQDGDVWICEIEKDVDEDLGLVFEENIMGCYQSCSNKCIFCFIDQLPKGMRETLYFKDDDSRLSFLKGNYITMTNMDDEEINRIISYHMSPINISVHTTNKELRKTMLKNKNAGNILEYIKKFAKANIQMNGQIVLCKNINDDMELDQTISDLTEFIPYLQSVSVVPVGISKYRDNLYPLEPFNKEDAKKIIDQIERWQKQIYKKHGIHFIHAADEFYIMSEEKLPKEKSYDGYLQIENGVGMMRSFLDEFNNELGLLKDDKTIEKELTIATAILPYPYIKAMVASVMNKFPNIKVNIYPIKNNYFGEYITVSGLLTGKDIIEELKDKQLGERLLLPANLLKADENILLDNISIEDIESTLQIKVHVVQSTGISFLENILN